MSTVLASASHRVGRDILELVDNLQLDYISALDDKDMARWLDTFSERPESSYVCNTAESIEAGRPVALILDDCRARLQDRVTFITKVWVGTYQDYRTRHFVQRTSCTATSEGTFKLRSNFSVAYVPSSTGVAELFMTGVYEDVVEIDGDRSAARFVSKAAITDSAVLPHYLVFPI